MAITESDGTAKPPRRKHGPTLVSDLVGYNLRELRAQAGLSQVQLSERLLERIGREVDHSAIAKIEASTRSVSVDELLALALALDVSPLRLLLPDARDETTTAQVTPNLAVPAGVLWAFCEQLAPWWDQSDPEASDPTGSRFEAWSRMRLGAEGIEADRRDAEHVVDASGGYAAVTDRLREIRGRVALFDLLDELGVALSSPAERRERRRAEQRAERVRDRPLERQIEQLTAQVAELTAALSDARRDDRRD